MTALATLLAHFHTVALREYREVLLEPVAPGLDLLCRGLRRISATDQEALERARLLYDALYAQLASESGGQIGP